MMSQLDIWKRQESQKGDAIIAVDEGGYGHMIMLLTEDDTKCRLHEEYDVLPELEYKMPPGLYYADMKIRPIYEDVEVDWDIRKPIYVFSTEFVSLIVNEYRFNSNDFTATTDDMRVITFDPFVGGAIELTDDEYYAQDKATRLVGHKFVVARDSVEDDCCSPLPQDVVSTTWTENLKCANPTCKIEPNGE